MMKIIPCPKCGRMPKITECVSFKNGTRKRIIGCPNFCHIIYSDKSQWGKAAWFIHIGNEDNNTLYKEWNEKVK